MSKFESLTYNKFSYVLCLSKDEEQRKSRTRYLNRKKEKRQVKDTYKRYTKLPRYISSRDRRKDDLCETNREMY